MPDNLPATDGDIAALQALVASLQAEVKQLREQGAEHGKYLSALQSAKAALAAAEGASDDEDDEGDFLPLLGEKS